jgi:hypothetical protein
MDFTVQISSKQEIDLETELDITFPKREQHLVVALIKLEIKESKAIKSDIGLKIDLMKRKMRIKQGLNLRSVESLDKMPLGYKIQILERL